jgi:hypothetical protein
MGKTDSADRRAGKNQANRKLVVKQGIVNR